VALVAVALLGGEGPGRGPGLAFVLPDVEPPIRRPRRCSQAPPWSWSRMPSGLRLRSRRPQGPTCRAVCPRPETRGFPSGGAPLLAPHPVRTRRLAHVEEDGAPQLGLGLVGVHLTDGRLGVVEQLSWCGHRHLRVSQSLCTGVKPYQEGRHSDKPGRVRRARRGVGGGVLRGAAAPPHGSQLRAGPLDDGLVRGLFEPALRAPSAGNTAGTAWVVLEGAERARYWELATTEEWQTRSRRFEGSPARRSSPSPWHHLRPTSSATASPTRRPRAGDTGSAAAARGLARPLLVRRRRLRHHGRPTRRHRRGVGCGVPRNFRHEHELLAAFGVPPHWRLFGTVLLGRPDAAITAPPRLTGSAQPSTRWSGAKGGESAVGTRRRVIAPERRKGRSARRRSGTPPLALAPLAPPSLDARTQTWRPSSTSWGVGV